MAENACIAAKKGKYCNIWPLNRIFAGKLTEFLLWFLEHRACNFMETPI